MIPERFDDILDFLGETADFVKPLIANLSEKELRLKPSPQEFSCIEHICHLRDIELEAYGVRIRKIVNEVKPVLRDVNGAKLAMERSYNSQNHETALSEFAQARKDNLEVIRATSPDALSRPAILENVGTITLARLITLMYEHDNDHRTQLLNLTTRLKEGTRA